MSEGGQKPALPGGEQTALERIAKAIEDEVARRTNESAAKAEESNRVRSAINLLLYSIPLLFVVFSAIDANGVETWLTDVGKLGLVVTVSLVVVGGTLQAVRSGLYRVELLAIGVFCLMVVVCQLVLQSRKEEDGICQPL